MDNRASTFFIIIIFLFLEQMHVSTVSNGKHHPAQNGNRQHDEQCPLNQSTSSPPDLKPRPSWATRVRRYFARSLDFGLLRHVTLSLFCAAGFLHKFTLNSYMSHMTGYGIHAGLSRGEAVWTVSVISITAFVGR